MDGEFQEFNRMWNAGYHRGWWHGFCVRKEELPEPPKKIFCWACQGRCFVSNQVSPYCNGKGVIAAYRQGAEDGK